MRLLLASLVALLVCPPTLARQAPTDRDLALSALDSLVPVPERRSTSEDEPFLALPEEVSITYTSGDLAPHATVLAEWTWRLTGTRPTVSAGEGGTIVLGLAELDAEEAYALSIRSNVRIEGRSVAGVARGTATLVQLLREGPAGWILPVTEIQDGPAHPFRSVMVDVARQPHSMETLRHVVDLAWFYKLRYVNLHLTDDQAFTFPFEGVTDQLPDDRTHPLEAWRALVDYADARGVTLVPELDLPGHSTQLKRSGYLEDPTPDTPLNDADVAHPVNHERIFRIVDAMCAVFDSSPYFHVGGDESGAGSTLVPFLAAVNAHLRAQADPKRLLVWEGFHGAPAEIPATGPDRVIVLAWESAYNPPWNLLAAGYEVVNASWKPLYVVGGGTPRYPHVGGRKWSAEEIADWGPFEFWHWQAGTPVFEDRGPEDEHRDDGIWHVPESQRPQVLGGQLLFWEQREHTVLPDAWRRVAALGARLWHADSDVDPVGFRRRLETADARARGLIQPVHLALAGDLDESHPTADDFVWFHGAVRARLSADPSLGGIVRYTLDGSDVTAGSTEAPSELTIDSTCVLRARLFVDDAPLGAEVRRAFDDRPARVRCEWFDLPRRALSHVPDFSDRSRWTPLRSDLLPELRGPYRTTEPVGQSLRGTYRVSEEEAGPHTFRIQTRDGRARLTVDGRVVGSPTEPSEEQVFATLELSAGPHAIRVDHAGGPISPVVLVAVRRPGQEAFQEISPLLQEIPRGTEPLRLASQRESLDLLAGGFEQLDWKTRDASVQLEDVAQLEDGVLSLTGRPSGYVQTRTWHRDYELELEWRWPDRPGNSGVLVHVTTPLLFYGWPRSLEVQLQNGRAGDFWTIGDDVSVLVEDADSRRTPRHADDLHRHRRIPRLVDDLERPLGEWNHMRIRCDGDEVTVWVNGIETNRGLRSSIREGAIALQSEGAPIEFRAVRVHPLPFRVD